MLFPQKSLANLNRSSYDLGNVVAFKLEIMSDDHLIDELKEDEQLAKALEFWQKYKKVIIIAIISIIIASFVGVYINYKRLEHKNNLSTQFFKAKLLLQNNSTADEGIRKLRQLAQNHPKYQIFTSYVIANFMAKNSEEKAKREYEKITVINNLDRIYKDLAVIKTGYLRLDNDDFKKLLPNIEKISVIAGPWKNMAIELQAVFYQKQSNNDKAKTLYDKIINSNFSTPDTKFRTQAYKQSVAK